MSATDIDEIGSTSLMTAALRARDTTRADRVCADPFAQAFVDAAGVRFPPAARSFLDLMGEQAAVRTRFLDEQIVQSGPQQVVLLASGMDTRAFRLDWPSGTTVFEVDRRAVLGFKDGVLSALAARPRCTRRVVATDLREDWVGALREAGFVPDRPTTWLAEGLLYALDGEAADVVLGTLTSVSVPGSTLAFDHVEATPALRRALRELDTGLDELWRGGPADPAMWLTRFGWTPRVRELADVAEPLGRHAPPEYTPGVRDSGHSWLVTATC